MKKNKSFIKRTNYHILSALATAANVTAKIGAGTASSWGYFQAQLPKELKR